MKKNWLSLFVTQFLGVINDNLLKSLICFISIYWAAPEHKNLIIAAASATMVIPFILLSPLAGYLSQIHEKRNILVIAKLAEIPIMGIAFTGFMLNQLPVVLFAMFCMGAQSALYSPAKYGLIKGLAGSNGIAKKVGTMELLSFIGVLSGTLVAGMLADFTQFQTAIIGIVLLGIASAGWLTSRTIDFKETIPKSQAKKNINPFTYLKNSYVFAKQYKGVNLSILGLGSFWFVGSMIQMNILIHCPETLGLSNTQTGLVTALVAVGIGLGCWVSGMITKNRLEMGLVCFAGVGLSIATFFLSHQNLSTPGFIVLLMVAAFFGGLFKIPLNAWVQERTDHKDIGNVLAYSNMIVFLFILLSAAVFALLQSYFSTHSIFIFVGITAALTTLISLLVMPARALRFVLWIVSKLLFKLRINGAQHIPQKSGGILIANHVSLLDAILIIAAAPRNVRFVMDEKIYHKPVIGRLFKKFNMIPVASGNTPKKLHDFTQRCIQEIHNGHLICLFPEGVLSRNGQLQSFKKGIEHFSKIPEIPIIPLHMDNLVGSPLSQKIGTNKRYGFNWRTLRKKIFISVDAPVYEYATAFQFRQKIKELEVLNFSRRAEGLSRIKAIHEAKKQLFKKDQSFFNDGSVTIHNLVINTPDYEVKECTGKPLLLQGTKPNSIGRPITGVSVKAVSKEGNDLKCNATGYLWLKHSFSDDLSWQDTGLMGSMDESGFITLSALSKS